MRRSSNSIPHAQSKSRRFPKLPWRVLRARIVRTGAIPVLFLVAVLFIAWRLVLAVNSTRYRKRHTSTLSTPDSTSAVGINTECAGAPTVRHVVPGFASSAPTMVHVQFGTNCTLYFVKEHYCVPIIRELASTLELPVLPCVKWSLPLSAATPRGTLRAFGVRSRTDARLPFRVDGALVHAHTAPFQALDAPDSRPYTWRANAPTALECGKAAPGSSSESACRAFIAALTLAYLSGCRPLDSDALWRPAIGTSTGASVGTGNGLIDADSALLAFPRGCRLTSDGGASGNGVDRVAGDVLARYLHSTCQLPSTVIHRLPKLDLNAGDDIRAAQVLKMTKAVVGRSFWSGWLNTIYRNRTCGGGGARRYENDRELAVLRSATLTWQQELDAAVGANIDT